MGTKLYPQAKGYLKEISGSLWKKNPSIVLGSVAEIC